MARTRDPNGSLADQFVDCLRPGVLWKLGTFKRWRSRIVMCTSDTDNRAQLCRSLGPVSQVSETDGRLGLFPRTVRCFIVRVLLDLCSRREFGEPWTGGWSPTRPIWRSCAPLSSLRIPIGYGRVQRDMNVKEGGYAASKRMTRCVQVWRRVGGFCHALVWWYFLVTTWRLRERVSAF